MVRRKNARSPSEAVAEIQEFGRICACGCGGGIGTVVGADVLVVAGDHATPAILAAHSWHPVPVLIRSGITRGDGVAEFTERACAGGSLGTFAAMHLMLLALSHAGKLTRYGP